MTSSETTRLTVDKEMSLKYHNATKHSEISIRTSGHYLDWDNKPSPFKIYNNLLSIPLPRRFPEPSETALKSVESSTLLQPTKTVDLDVLAELLFFSAGLTRRVKIGGEGYYMRAASATGALYPIEIYVISSGIPNLAPGVYHFNPLEFSLVYIREGDFGPQIASATDGEAASADTVIAMTSLAWRNSWKYQERSYRHWFWDSGVVAANLLATCFSVGLKTRLLIGFVDSKINELLGLKPRTEATVALAVIGQSRNITENRTLGGIPEIDLETEPLSKDEMDYPIIWETNKASELLTQSAVREWRDGFQLSENARPLHEPAFPLQLSREETPSLAKVILQRGSTRKFAQRPISFEALSTIIDASSKTIPLDFLHNDQSLMSFYLIANEVQNLEPGSYFFNRDKRSLEQLKAGKMRYISGYLSLEQLLFSDASAVFFLMTDLDQVLDDLGNRGYRAAQFEAGVRAGKIYLSSYAVGIGASGTTFYDDAVTEFFSPHAKNMSTMMAVGVGVPAYKARPGKILPQFHSSSR